MYFISDGAILNDTKSKQLQRILAEFHHLSEAEIHLACILLESYHAVYRRDRLVQRRNQLTSGQARIKELCLAPTTTQLHEIAGKVNAKANLKLGTEDVLTHLQELVKRLRQYRIYVRGSLRMTASFNGQQNQQKRDRLQPSDFINNRDNPDEPTQFLAWHHTVRQCSQCQFTQSPKNGRRCGK